MIGAIRALRARVRKAAGCARIALPSSAARRLGLSLACGMLSVTACRGRPVADLADPGLPALVDSLIPGVERAVGKRFTSTPASAVVSRESVRDYLAVQLERELPRRKRDGLVAAYKLLGLLPDSLDLERLILQLYTEQVAGYYDFDTKTLYGVEGADPQQLRLVMAHELVHALQGQLLPLDAMMRDSALDSDAKTARQAVLEGQATLASILVLAPARDLLADDGFWEIYREQIATTQDKLPAFKAAPAVLRTGLIFPYLNGAEFMRWWLQHRPTDSLPYGAAMPRSTEQILSPDRYDRGDAPWRVQLCDAPTDAEPLIEDVFGELEFRLLADERTGTRLMERPLPIGWAGDRWRAWRTPQGSAMELVVFWDDARAAARYDSVLAVVARGPGAGRAGRVDRLEVGGLPGHRVLLGPSGWAWLLTPPSCLPTVTR